MSLTTLAKLKTHLSIPQSDNSEDAFLNQILLEIDTAVLRFCKRDFASAAATEYYDGTGRETLILKRRPVTAVAGVWVDQAGYYGHNASGFPASSAWTIGQQFAPPSLAESEQNGGLLLALPGGWPANFGGPWSGCSNFGWAAGTWPEGRGNIKVTYTAGYTVIPDDLELAVHHLAAALRSTAEKGLAGPVGSETFGEYSYSLLRGSDAGASGADVVMARGILAGYRDVSL